MQRLPTLASHPLIEWPKRPDWPHMDVADFIRLSREEPLLLSLVIGGYAVAAHGHTRATFDVDFLVCHAQAKRGSLD